ncbi:MAG: SDR family oxidoreductase [Promethearchaeota archaeon]
MHSRISTNNLRVLITGASRGIGKTITQILISNGYSVIGTSRVPSNIPMENRIDDVKYLPLDLLDERSIDSLIQSVGNVDILINNAGSSQVGSIEEISISNTKKYFQLLYFGVVQLTQGLIPQMRKRGSGWIINITSMAGKSPVPFSAYYAGAKSALNVFTRSLRYELKSFGINICALAPGPINTTIPQELILNDNSPYEESLENMKKVRDLAINHGSSPEKVAEKILKILRIKRRYRLKSYYDVGRSAQFLSFLNKFLPDNIIEYIIMKKFNISLKKG